MGRGGTITALAGSPLLRLTPRSAHAATASPPRSLPLSVPSWISQFLYSFSGSSASLSTLASPRLGSVVYLTASPHRPRTSWWILLSMSPDWNGNSDGLRYLPGTTRPLSGHLGLVGFRLPAEATTHSLEPFVPREKEMWPSFASAMSSPPWDPGMDKGTAVVVLISRRPSPLNRPFFCPLYHFFMEV